MKLIWTKSTMPLSLLIRWGLKEPCSHFAIAFDVNKDETRGILFQSNLLGTGIVWFPAFKKYETIVHEIEVDLPLEQEEAIYQAVLDAYSGKSYDYKAFAYFSWRAILFRVFGKAFPAKNAWGSEKAFICVGLAQALKERADQLPPELKTALDAIPDFEMTSPEQLYQKLSTPQK